MATPYELIFANKTPSEVLKSLANTTRFDLESAAEELTGNELGQLGVWTFHKLSTVGVQSALWFGGLLHLYRLATKKEDRREFFQNMIEDLEVSESKAYIAIQVFEQFGRVLMKEPELMGQFAVESLRILAAKNAPSSACEAAIEQARTGKRITIKHAKALVHEHTEIATDNNRESAVTTAEQGLRDLDGTDDRDDDMADSQKKAARNTHRERMATAPTKRRWSYRGTVARLTIEVLEPRDVSELPLIIRDVEAALKKLRQEYGSVDNNRDRPNAA